MNLDLAPVKEFFGKHFSPDSIKAFLQKHWKKLAIAGGAAAVIILAIVIIAALPGPVEEHTFRAAQDEYLVMMMFSSDWDMDVSDTATLTHQKSGGSLTANFIDGKRSFCYLVEETGVYDFSYLAQDGTSVTRRISVDENNHLYFVVIFPE